ncbi:MAG: hypothetical protein U1E89_21995 [Burkholderiaceae bacterium]
MKWPLGAGCVAAWCVAWPAMALAHPAVAAPWDAAVDVLQADAPALPLHDWRPAGGALQRHTSRAGAWYALVLLPMTPGQPVQLALWPHARAHQVRISVLDAPPDAAPAVVLPVPVHEATRAARGALRTVPLVLPAHSQADAVYLLIEQWSASGARPPVVHLQARTRVQLDPAAPPWWSSAAGDARHATAPAVPAGPLGAASAAVGLLELRIGLPSPLPAPTTQGWR